MPSTTPRSDAIELPLRRRLPIDAGELSSWLLFGYFLLIVASFFLLRRPEVMPRGNELNADRALFNAVNVGTLCGFQPQIGIAQARLLGQITAFVLTVGSTVCVLIVGGLALKRVAGFRHRDREIIIGAVAVEIGAILIGGVALLTPDRGVFLSMQQAASAFAGAGTLLGPLSSPLAWRTHAVIMPLALLGSLGIPVLLDLRDWLFKSVPMNRFSRIVISMTAGAYIVGFLAMCAIRMPMTSVDAGQWKEIVAEASVASNNVRLSGLPYSWSGLWPRAAQWVVMLLMFVGGTTGGLAGGLKLTTLHELAAGVRRSLRGEAAGRLFGIAMLWTVSYVAVILVTLIVLTSLEPETPADRLLFLAISAVGNIGLSHDRLSSTGPSLFVLSVAMLVGRVAPLMFLWWTARSVRDVDNAVS